MIQRQEKLEKKRAPPNPYGSKQTVRNLLGELNSDKEYLEGIFKDKLVATHLLFDRCLVIWETNVDKCLEIIPDYTGVGLDRFHCILVLSQRPLRDLCLFVFGAARLKGTFHF